MTFGLRESSVSSEDFWPHHLTFGRKGDLRAMATFGTFGFGSCSLGQPPVCAVVIPNNANILREPTSGGTQPRTKPSAALENPKAADELEPDREPDLFDNEEEYVVVDDEAMYDEVPHPPEFAQSQPFENDNSNTTADRSDDFVHVEVEVDDADPLEVNVLHDPENPKGSCLIISLHSRKKQNIMKVKVSDDDFAEVTLLDD